MFRANLLFNSKLDLFNWYFWMPPLNEVLKRKMMDKSPFLTHISFQPLPHFSVLQFLFFHFLLNSPMLAHSTLLKISKVSITMLRLNLMVISQFSMGLTSQEHLTQLITCFITMCCSFCFQDTHSPGFSPYFSDYF